MENLLMAGVGLALLGYLFYTLFRPDPVLGVIMNAIGWIQLALFIAFLFLITKPLGIHLFKVLESGGKTISAFHFRAFGTVFLPGLEGTAGIRNKVGSATPRPC